MQNLARTVAVALCSSMLALHAPAQGRFCIGGDTAKLTASAKSSCRQKLDTVRAAAARFHTPEDWHFVVVCDEEGWADYAAFSKRPSAVLAGLGADTDLGQRSTFFRADRLSLAGDDLSTSAVIAHEIASIVVNSSNEEAIQKQLAAWLPRSASPSSATAPVLSASLRTN